MRTGTALPASAAAPTPRRSRPARRTAAVLLSLVVSLALVSAPAARAQAPEPLDADELGADVQLGYGGAAVRGRWLPVTVTLAPTRLFAGEIHLVAETTTGRMVERREVEAAAGSTKVYRFLLPPSHGVTVQLAEAGAEDAVTVRASVEHADDYLVGVLGDELPRDLPPVVSHPLGQRGRFVPVPPAFLERSSRALDPLSALVVPAADLAALDDATRDVIATGVTTGTDLVVVAPADGAIDLGLPWSAAETATTGTIVRDDGTTTARLLTAAPGAWGLSATDLGWGPDDRPLATAVNAGKGRLIVAGVAPGEGAVGRDGAFWARLLQPNRPTSASVEGDGLERVNQSAGEGLRSDTVSLPPLPVVGGFLLAYLLLVGPLNGLVLARIGRRELAWVTVPVMTVIFAGGAFVAAGGGETGTGLSGRAAYWIDGQGAQVQAAAIRAPRVGDHEVAFDGPGWDLAPATMSHVPAVVDRRDGDTVLRMQLEALQVGTVTAVADVDREPPLGLDLDPLADGVRVTVTNRTTHTIEDLRLRAGTVVEPVGRLAAGDHAVVELSQDTLPVVHDWHDDFAGLRGPDGHVVAPRSLEALLRWSVVDGNPGIVWATGTVRDDLGLGVPTADGAPADDQGTFLAVGLTAGTPDSDTLPWEVDRDLLTVGFGEGWRPGPLAIEGRVEAVLRYRLPHEGTVGALVSTLERGRLDGHGGDRPVPEGEPPPCPPDAASCHFDGDTFEVCFPDGGCKVEVFARVEPMPPDLVGPGGARLEIYDHLLGQWIGLGDAFADGRPTTDYVGPLGEVYVRVSGELHPFDFSGRGIAVTRGEA